MGIQRFWGSGYITHMHDEWINDHYFSLVGFVARFPNYKNKRIYDPQVKMFIDQENISYDKSWDLPVPNAAAAYKSLAKYGKSEVVMSDDDVNNLNRAWSWMERHFSPYMGNSAVLSLQGAVDRLDMSTSSGSPFNQLYSTKRLVFENDPDILMWLETDWNVLASDPLWTTIFTSSLKEELRPVQKIVENSQRTFAAGALDATVHGTRLFADMNEKMYASHLQTASAIGMSPLKGNWHRLYTKLAIFDDGYALDETQYDSSLRSFLMWGCAKFRWACLAKEYQTLDNWNRVRTYYRNLTNTLMLTPDGILMLKKLGNPSGSVDTVTDNTLILYWMLAFAWIKNAPTDMNHYVDFENHTSKALLGDDNTWTVSKIAHEFYNGTSVINSWLLLGIVTTSDTLLPRKPADLDFLSAQTVFLQGFAVPLYDRNKLMQSLLYAPSAHLTPETTLQRVTNLLQIGWTDLPFRNFCRELIDWLLKTYDKTLCENPRWIIAKAGIQSDNTLFALFTGKKIILQGQCLSGIEEEVMPDNDRMSVAQPNQVGQSKRGRRRRQRRARQGQPGKTIVRENIIVQQRPRRSRNRAGRQRPRLRNRRRGALAGKGRTQNNTTNRNSMPVTEDEYIGEVTVANQPNFNVVAYPVNPGQVGTFPWLSTLASRFEKYQFDFLEFYFKREVSEFATNGQVGKVILSFDPDAADAPPSSKVQMEAMDPHKDGMPCENISLLIPPRMLKRLNDAMFVRPGGLPGAADIKTYDIGNLFVATQGILNNVAVGELHVRYGVRLMIPVIESIVGAPANNSVSLFTGGQVGGGATTVGVTVLFGTTVFNPLGITYAAGIFTLPAGNYLVDAQLTNGASVGFTSVVTALEQNNAPIETCTVTSGAVFTAFNSTISTFIQSPGVASTWNILNTATFASGTNTIDACSIRFTAI